MATNELKIKVTPEFDLPDAFTDAIAEKVAEKLAARFVPNYGQNPSWYVMPPGVVPPGWRWWSSTTISGEKEARG